MWVHTESLRVHMDAPHCILDLSMIPTTGVTATFSVEEEAGRIFQGGEQQAAKAAGC